MQFRCQGTVVRNPPFYVIVALDELHDCQPGYVSPLSDGAGEYDYVAGNGHLNIGKRIDAAAKAVGR